MGVVVLAAARKAATTMATKSFIFGLSEGISEEARILEGKAELNHDLKTDSYLKDE